MHWRGNFSRKTHHVILSICQCKCQNSDAVLTWYTKNYGYPAAAAGSCLLVNIMEMDAATAGFLKGDKRNVACENDSAVSSEAATERQS